MKLSISRIAKLLADVAATFITAIRYPKIFAKSLLLLPQFCRGLKFADQWPAIDSDPEYEKSIDNPLWEYFCQHQEGPGIWKWTQYFEAYHRHLSKFRGQSVNLLEIGIYSGGSLSMWLSYFGELCQVFGVDIEEACKKYEGERVQVFIGDQEDRGFWKGFRQSNPAIHILIDDGGHTPEQQMTTLEEMLPHMPVGSVYICEDIQGRSNRFTAFATAFVHRLNATNLDGQSRVAASNLQRAFHSIHFYPYLMVIEKHQHPPQLLTAPKHGTEWQPFKVNE